MCPLCDRKFENNNNNISRHINKQSEILKFVDNVLSARVRFYI